MPLTPDDITQIAQAVGSHLDAKKSPYWVAPEEHAKQHKFLGHLIEDFERRRQSREKLKGSIYGYLIISCIGGFGLLVWLGFKELIVRGGS